MADTQHLIAQERDLAVKPAQLRRQGQLPANIFGAAGSRAITVATKDMTKLLDQVSESTVFYLDLAGQSLPVMLAEIQRHPISGEVIHVALHQIDLSQKVTAAIPFVVTGTFNVPGAYYHLVNDEVEAEALPTDLPANFTVNVSTLKAIGDEITYADLAYDRQKVTLKVEDEKLPVVVVNQVVEEAEEESATETSTDATAPATESTPADKAS